MIYKGLWSSGMMLALGARDREFDSPKSPSNHKPSWRRGSALGS